MFVVWSLILIPFIGAIHVALTEVKDNIDVRKIRKLSLMYTCFRYFISIMMWIEFNPSNVGIQIVSEFSDWDMFNIAFGVDGLSLFFVILTALTIPIAIISSYYMENKKQKLYLCLILLFSGFIISVFISLDLIIFYVSFEVILSYFFIWKPKVIHDILLHFLYMWISYYKNIKFNEMRHMIPLSHRFCDFLLYP